MKLLCLLFGHDDKFSYPIIDTKDNKQYKITICSRCDYEKKEEVK